MHLKKKTHKLFFILSIMCFIYVFFVLNSHSIYAYKVQEDTLSPKILLFSEIMQKAFLPENAIQGLKIDYSAFYRHNLIPSFTVDDTKPAKDNFEKKFFQDINVEIVSIGADLIEKLKRNGLENANTSFHIMFISPDDYSPKVKLNPLIDQTAELLSQQRIYDYIKKLKSTAPVSIHMTNAFAPNVQGVKQRKEILQNFSHTELIKKIKKTVQVVKNKLKENGLENHVLLENTDYSPGNEFFAHPEVIRQVLKETGCGLLIDLQHLIISASYIKMTPIEYFRGLINEENVDILEEIHICVPVEENGKGIDSWESEWMHGGQFGVPAVSFYEDTKGTRLVEELLVHIFDLRKRANAKSKLIVNFETDDDFAASDMRKLKNILDRWEQDQVKKQALEISKTIFIPSVTLRFLDFFIGVNQSI